MKTLLFVFLFTVQLSANPFIDQPWGDVNCSGSVNIADAVFLLDYIFAGGPEPGCDDTDDTVPAIMRAPGTIGHATVADLYRIIRTPLWGDSIPDKFIDVPVDGGQLAGDQVRFNLPYPRNGMWYQFNVNYRVAGIWYPADSMQIRSEEYEVN